MCYYYIYIYIFYSGKTTLVNNILKNWKRLVPDSPNVWQFILMFEHNQPLYDDMIKNVQCQFPNCKVKCLWSWDEKTMSDPNLFKSESCSGDGVGGGGQTVLIIDDSLHKLNKLETLAAICRGRSHHENISVFIIFQDITSCGSQFRSALKNMHYFIVTQGSAELLQYLQFKLFMYMRGFLHTAFDMVSELTESKYPYIMINNRPSCPKNRSVTTGLVEGGDKVYMLAPI